MDLNRVFRIQEKAIDAMFSIFSSAISFKLKSHEITEKIVELKKSLPKRTPYYVTTFLDGMHETFHQDLYRNHLEFCYTVSGKVLDDSGNMVILENEIVSTHKDTGRYYEDIGIKPSELQKMSTSSGHYWKETDKPFFVTAKCLHGVDNNSFTSKQCLECEEQKCPHVN